MSIENARNTEEPDPEADGAEPVDTAYEALAFAGKRRIDIGEGRRTAPLLGTAGIYRSVGLTH
jgi:hypothetical protein